MCGECFKKTDKMSRTRMKGIPYDEFHCTQCGKQSNRHSNAAQTASILLQKKLDSSISKKFNLSPISSNDGLGL